MIKKRDWEVLALNMLRAELSRKGITIAQLADLINRKEEDIGKELKEGEFSAAFLLQCFSAIGSHEIRF